MSTTESTSAPLPPSAKEYPLGHTVLPEGRGVAFRVWAPNADHVAVIGDFNDWSPLAHPLKKDADGNWSGAVANAGEGQAYRYLLRRGEDEFTRIDPRALKVTNSVGNGIVWTPPPLSPTTREFIPPALDALVVYELHIGTFRIAPGGVRGNFEAAAGQLPYLRDLGVNCVELMPVAEFAGDLSWGYNPAHPWAVESCYGGPEGLRAFVETAHAHGIAVVLDVVYNHFGPGDLHLWQFDGWSHDGMGGVYFFNDDRAHTPWGSSRPDYGRGEVRAYIRDNAMMWLETHGVDGLRWDATAYVRTKDGNEGCDIPEGWSLCQWLNDELRAAKPGFITIAEDLRDNPWVVKDTGAGGAGFCAQWDGGFVHPVRAVLAAVRDEDRNLDAVAGALRRKFEDDAFRRVVYSESHDEVANGKQRMPSEIDGDAPDSFPARKRSTLGAVLTLTAPGVPMLFQGQEFLEDGWFRDERPLDWRKLALHGSIHALYRDLIRLRRDLDHRTAGLTGQHIEVNHVDHEGKVIAYRRWREGGAGDDVLVVINLSGQTRRGRAVGVPAEGRWHVRLNTDSSAYSGDFKDRGPDHCDSAPEPLDGYEHRVVVDLGPYSALILSQDRA